MRKLTTKAIKLKEVKFQLSIWKYGVWFSEFNIYYSKNSKARTVEELVQILKDIIRSIIGKCIASPEVAMLICKNLSIIGQLTADIIEIDTKHKELKRRSKIKLTYNLPNKNKLESIITLYYTSLLLHLKQELV